MPRVGKKVRGLYRRGRYWWIDYTDSTGKRHFESTRTTLKSEALQILEERRVQARAGKIPLKTKPVLFKDFAKKYMEHIKKLREFDSRKYRVNKLVKEFGDLKLSEFTTVLVEEYQSKRIAQGCANATVNRELAILKHMIHKAVDWDLIDDDVLKRVRKVKQLKENNRRLRYLSREEADRLIAACYKAPKCSHLAPIIITALHTGMRRSEILKLKWDDIDFRAGFIYVKDSKNYQSRMIPLSDTLKQTLQSLPRHITSPYVFCREDGKPYNEVKKGFNRVVKYAGIKDFHFHDLRHTFASWLVMGGTDLATVKELLGHKSINMTMRYAHLAPDHKEKAIKVLDGTLRYNYVTIDKKQQNQMAKNIDF